MQKCFVADPLKHNKVKNRGELPQYYISDCHEPIIDKETFDKVQEILQQRAEAVPTYPFTKKIVCGTCGHPFTRKKGKVRGKTYIHWICRGKKEVGMTCSSVNFSEEELEKISAQMMGTQDFESEAFENAVSMITVEKNGDLRFQFTDGSAKVWENLHLHPQRHEAILMKEPGTPCATSLQSTTRMTTGLPSITDWKSEYKDYSPQRLTLNRCGELFCLTL